MVAQCTGQSLSSISEADVFRYSAAWESEPPLLAQIRDLLALQTSVIMSALGNKTDPNELIPSRYKEDLISDEDAAIADMALFFGKHNATLQ